MSKHEGCPYPDDEHDGWCVWCENAQLRADLATVTSERDEHAKHRANLDRKIQEDQHWYHDWQAERAAHAETAAERDRLARAVDSANEPEA